jgi:enoyl-CoA hydratase
MSYQQFHVEVRERVAIATIRNPPMNYMNAIMVAEMHQLLHALDEDAAVRAVILTGGVPGIFITHYDVEELIRASEAAGAYAGGKGEAPDTSALDFIHGLFNFIAEMRKPVIAALNGTAMGGGCELALACDFRIMARGGHVIGLPEVTVGILPGAGGTQRMTRLIGKARALEMILLGKRIEADEAERIGLVHRAVDDGMALDEAMSLAMELALMPPVSVREIKRCIHEGGDLPLREGIEVEKRAFVTTMNTKDARDGMKAFQAGRAAEFTGE